MKQSNFILLGLLNMCTAQTWALGGCDKLDEKAIKASMKDAVTIANTAFNVLNTQYQEEKVQSMVKFILGSDNALQSKVETAKKYLGNVAKFERDENPLILQGEPFVDNKDVIIWCDNSNYDSSRRLNKALNIQLPKEEWEVIQDCFDPKPKSGPARVMANTTPSDGVHPDYAVAFTAWSQGGSIGPPPDMTPFKVERPEKPNTIDLCRWYLDTLGVKYFTRIDDETIGKVHDQNFPENFPPDRKPVDAFAETLTGTLLHELTHTNAGGKAIDVVAAGGCYGWVCVGNLYSAENADSISLLGICLYLFSKGFWVDDGGNVKKI